MSTWTREEEFDDRDQPGAGDDRKMESEESSQFTDVQEDLCSNSEVEPTLNMSSWTAIFHRLNLFFEKHHIDYNVHINIPTWLSLIMTSSSC